MSGGSRRDRWGTNWRHREGPADLPQIDLPVTPIDLDEDEKVSLERRMAVGYRVFQRAAFHLYGEGSPANVKRLRKEYLEGNERVLACAGVCRIMGELQTLELRIMAGFIRIALGYVKSVYLSNRVTHPDVAIGDYLTEAMWGIWDAVYTYDGIRRGWRFASFLGGVVKHRLINFVRSEERTAGIGRKIKALRKRVKELIRDEGMDTEEALTFIEENGEADPLLVDQVRASMALFVQRETMEQDAHVQAPDADMEAMREAVKVADLTPLERELIEAHLRNDRGYRARMAKERRNPNTGRLYTRQWLGQVYQRACDKITEVYEGQLQKVA